MDSARHSSTFPFPTLFLSISRRRGHARNITYLDCWHFVDFSFSFFFVYFFLAGLFLTVSGPIFASKGERLPDRRGDGAADEEENTMRQQ
jgi:hypothetical protein